MKYHAPHNPSKPSPGITPYSYIDEILPLLEEVLEKEVV